VEVRTKQADLGRDVNPTRHAEVAQGRTQERLGLAVAIGGGRVEPVNSGFQGAANGVDLLFLLSGFGEQGRHGPSAKGKGGDLNTSRPKRPVIHDESSAFRHFFLAASQIGPYTSLSNGGQPVANWPSSLCLDRMRAVQ